MRPQVVGFPLTLGNAREESLPALVPPERAAVPMNFDKAVVSFPNGDVRRLDPPEFFAIPLGERIELMVASRIRFEKDNRVIPPLEAMKKT
jgi:hypothetical protein